MIETFEDSIVVKDKVIEQLQEDQKGMMRKIQMMKKELETAENFETVSSVSANDQHSSFVNDITQRLTYAKMNMGFSSEGNFHFFDFF